LVKRCSKFSKCGTGGTLWNMELQKDLRHTHLRRLRMERSLRLKIRHSFLPLRYYLKLLIILRMIRTHDAVPYIEVQAIIATDIAVVHIVMHRRIMPAGQRSKPRWPITFSTVW
jgi:hypothetical protein